MACVLLGHYWPGRWPTSQGQRPALTRAVVQDVNVGSQSHVVCEIPPWVIRVVVEHEIVRVPQPIVHIADVTGKHTEIKTVEPKAPGASAGEAENMARSEAAGETAMFERTVQVKSWVVAANVVTYPGVSAVDVRCVGMIGLVVKMADLRSRLSWTSNRLGWTWGRLGCAWRRHCCARRGLYCAWRGLRDTAERRRAVLRRPGGDKTSMFATASSLLRDGKRTPGQTQHCQENREFPHCNI